MARLINRFPVSIDDKGRVVLPAVHRERYAAGTVMVGRGDHIAVYEPAAWDEFVQQLTERRLAGQISRENFNFYTTSAADPKPDSAGRVLVPAWMREELGLGREAVIAGAHEYLAIYPKGYFESIPVEKRREAYAQLNEMGL